MKLFEEFFNRVSAENLPPRQLALAVSGLARMLDRTSAGLSAGLVEAPNELREAVLAGHKRACDRN